MAIKPAEIKKLASLSRLVVDDKTITDVTDRLSSVLA